MTDERCTRASSTERAHHAGDSESAAPRQPRMSSQRKQEAVLRVLRGEDLELVSREFGVTAAALSDWRDSFLAAGAASLKSRPEDDRDRELRADPAPKEWTGSGCHALHVGRWTVGYRRMQAP